ncbi:MAG: ribosome maturation factor RimM [Thermaerobacter sp.]|nr:ribosome maturation factor RimM [Thermaerobacter sp.]
MGQGTIDRDPVRIGRIVGVHGLDGGLKVYPASDHVDTWALRLRRVWLQGEARTVRGGRTAGGQPVILLSGVTDRTTAERLVGADVFVAGEELPGLPPNEYYWHDLIGLRVFDVEGERVGIATAVVRGAGDVLEVEGPRGRALVPLALAWVDVNPAGGRVTLRRVPEWVSDAD